MGNNYIERLKSNQEEVDREKYQNFGAIEEDYTTRSMQPKNTKEGVKRYITK